MKSIGITRKLDVLGRIVIPKELRKTMEIDSGTPIEIFIEDDLIILRKYSPNRACLVTGDILPDNIEYQGGIILSPKGAELLVEQIKILRKSDLLHS
ncbi:AbrB/MazE/SpoVT family DNA-binding domain-containing protein [Sporosarcina sp. resist]|uniref:AbrB/MazE/SpoVT family DNA-binding domain-containing protein n=1 Tax=Sporosarcina sp. resist TaxID=2762563 RepID=UPI00164DEC4B|nr:AbrB/MazE/SpoVT family DNA-binding domain-containing protein [Sporosarcina sp. resist]QNK89459.1 AbrB/MazE/SpoVT family DNA-binding domain-containing protein [Sporosarcina sp. resist]